MSALGDLFVALPHVDVISAHHPNDEVWLLTSPPYEELFYHHPRMNVTVLDRNGRFSRNSTLGRVRWIRRQRFSVIYDLQGNRTSRILVRFSNAKITVGTQPRSIYRFHPELPYTRDTQQNVFDRLNDTLAAAGLPRANPGCTLYPSAEDLDRVFRWKTQNRLDNKDYALMHAGSSVGWPSKRWPQERYLELAKMIEESGLRCVWLGSEEDEAVNRYLSRSVGIDATGQFSLLQLYLMGKGASFAVTNDSGPMHILAASGIPVYSFFGPTSRVRSHSAGQGGRTLFANADCSPCFKGVCPPEKQHVCLDTLAPETVFSKIRAEMEGI
jgi:heptosyltransferase-1